MSSMSERPAVKISIADFANITPESNKGNAVGMGGYILPIAQTGLTVRFSVFTEVCVPGDLCPCELTLELSLRDQYGHVVELLGPVPQKIRVASVLTVETVQGLTLDQKNFIGGHALNVLDFASGLPLSPGNYVWKATIDSDEEHAAELRFCIPIPQTQPVLG